MRQIEPINDNLIIKVIEPKSVSAGGIIIPDKHLEESCIGIVVKQNPVSYYRDGTQRPPVCNVGDTVVFAKRSGTAIPQAPQGEKWLAIPEDCIYYKVVEE